ncbi:carbohydrate ABC transporter permease [Paenibacillus eucommiae]|uniref:Aldouronate transport system permease protein n=1 Tax=Paenibacillus eucommiae TaxID=1355755 RepID=A0ABS4IT74_9BACL|nr:carbohydrate ABC transporter permease [Paenibacillus eucommiae]MBP1990755.1 putative aldouronate transport system permease protein [Paenibacillus eucommiae]
MVDRSKARFVFQIANYVFLTILSFLCLFPMIHVIAISLSSSSAAGAGLVTLWPVEFTLKSYKFILSKPEFMRSIWISIERVFLGTLLNMLFTLIIAYPLSKDKKDLKFRMGYAWFFVFTMLFGGGLIPTFMVIKYTGLLDSIWALVIPGAVPVFNVILLLNFFRGLPKELEESAFIDGAGYWSVLWKIYLPLSLPALATVGLFTIVGHWNAWFDGYIYMNSPDKQPLATYLQSVLKGVDLLKVTGQDVKTLAEVSDRTAKAAQIFVGALPVLMIYPFLQKYFVKGLVLGSVKG